MSDDWVVDINYEQTMFKDDEEEEEDQEVNELPQDDLKYKQTGRRRKIGEKKKEWLERILGQGKLVETPEDVEEWFNTEYGEEASVGNLAEAIVRDQKEAKKKEKRKSFIPMMFRYLVLFNALLMIYIYHLIGIIDVWRIYTILVFCFKVWVREAYDLLYKLI